jgi:DNA-directed RNA polymerase subunit RPC12/RpoP
MSTDKGTVFSRIRFIPALDTTVCDRPCRYRVKRMIGVFGNILRSSAAACKPFMTGIERSKMITSGLICSAASMPSWLFSASTQVSKSSDKESGGERLTRCEERLRDPNLDISERVKIEDARIALDVLKSERVGRAAYISPRRSAEYPPFIFRFFGIRSPSPSSQLPYNFLIRQGYDRSVMASWGLRCVKCGRSFMHSPIADEHIDDYFFPPKPEFPTPGSELKCPNCGYTALYQRSDLIYQAQSGLNPRSFLFGGLR